MNVLEVSDLHKWFGGVHAVDGVTFNVKEKEIVGIIGPNGSGKTTLFNVISGFYRPNAGEVYLNGERIDGMSPDKIFKKGLIRSFQVPRPFGGMTVLENVLVAPRDQLGEKVMLAPFPSSWKAQEVRLADEAADTLDTLALLQVHGNLSPDISGGQMKLSELGRALMGHPKVLLLDEPTAGVAPRLAVDIFQRIVTLRDTVDITFCIIEHRLDVLFRFIERGIVLHEGRIIAEGTHDEILANKMVQDVYLGG